MVASDWINFFPSNLNVTTYKMTCGSRRKFIKRHRKAMARSQQLLVSKIWKSQKNSAPFPAILHSIMLPRGHGTWMHRALGAGFQCLFQKAHDRWFHIRISRGEGEPNLEEIEISIMQSPIFRMFPSFGLKSALFKLSLSRREHSSIQENPEEPVGSPQPRCCTLQNQHACSRLQRKFDKCCS